MTSGEQPPDVAELAQSMLLLHGVHDDEHTSRSDDDDVASWAKAPDFANDPRRAAAVHEATRRDRERYLTAGLAEVDCRFCHASVQVKKLGAPYTAVQWNTAASGRCAYFAEIRAGGGNSARAPSCPRLSDSIKHAIAEGCLEEYSSAPAPGDG
ncbi:MAG: hypothetical protein ACOYBX_03950 [Mycobacterium sp.]